MKFDYSVKHNGIYYPAGANVPIEDNSGEGVKAPAVSSGKVEETVKPVSKYDTHKYTEDDLNVSIQQLRKLAKENGLKIANTDRSEDIREMLRAL